MHSKHAPPPAKLPLPPRNPILRSAKHVPPLANPKPKAPNLKPSDVTESDQVDSSGSEEGDDSGSEEEGDEEEDEKRLMRRRMKKKVMKKMVMKRRIKKMRYYREESAETGSPRVIVYGYDGLPMQPVAPPSPDYVSGLEYPPSPDKDPKEAPEDDHADYPADGGDGDDEPSDDDDDDDDDSNDEDEEPFEDEEDDEEEGEHLALTDSSVVPFMDLIPPTSNTKAFETDESAPTPGSPQTIIPFSHTRLRSARKTVRLEPPILTDTGAPLGFRAAKIRMRALLPSTFHRTDIPEADVPPRKRDFLTTPALGFEALIDRGIAAALAERDADRSRNGDNNNDLGTSGRRQELALMCDRMYPEESAKVERYIGGLPDMIHSIVKASKT
nr:hypothetical protein [Tanacetum cinerariifolium]